MSDNLFSNSAPAVIDRASRVLVVVPCGRSKIWKRDPVRSSVAAAEVYTGTPFRLNRQYAERFGEVWVVLSADYGLIPPDVSIPDLYGVSFKRGTSLGLPQRPSPLPRRRHHLRCAAARRISLCRTPGSVG